MMTDAPMRRNVTKGWQNEGTHVAIGASKQIDVSQGETQLLIPCCSMQLRSSSAFLVRPHPATIEVRDAEGGGHSALD